jgi:stage III sporulation protein SpoIIIAA
MTAELFAMGALLPETLKKKIKEIPWYNEIQLITKIDRTWTNASEYPEILSSEADGKDEKKKSLELSKD